MKFIDTFTQDRKTKIFTGILTILIVYTLLTYMITLFAFISPNQDQRWSGSVVSTTPSTIHPGNAVTITAFYEEGLEYKLKDQYYYFASSENVRCIVTVLDPNNKPVFIYSEQIDAQGDITLNPIYPLPSTAMKGTYKVRVFVWTDWLPGGESRTFTIEEYEFEVV